MSLGTVTFFLITESDDAGLDVLRRIYDAIIRLATSSRGADARVFVTRSAWAVTFFFAPSPAPIQVVLSTYKSTADLLASFDVDAAACAFQLSRDAFVCTPRCRRALEHGVNIADSTRHSRTYFHRLEKYARRGFAVALPGFNVGLVSPVLTTGTYVLMKKHDLLLRIAHSADPGVSTLDVPAGGRTMTVRCRKQLATRVIGIKRLVVLSYSRHVREVEPPYLARSAPRLVSAQNLDEGVVLVKGDVRGEYFLLTGLCCSDDDQDSEEGSSDDGDSGNYSMSPTAKAVALFESCLKQQMMQADGPRSTDDSWCEGGAMTRIHKSMTGSGAAAKSFANHHTWSRLMHNEKLSFVYDVVDPNKRSFEESLNFVLNAGQKKPARTYERR